MRTTYINTRRRRLTATLAAATLMAAGLAAQAVWTAVEPRPHRRRSSTPAAPCSRIEPRAPPARWGVTFSFETSSLAGGPYTDSWPVHNVPMYQASTAGSAQFWLNYVEELVSAGVDFVAVDTRGYIPGSTVPNEGGDPRELTQLVARSTRPASPAS